MDNIDSVLGSYLVCPSLKAEVALSGQGVRSTSGAHVCSWALSGARAHEVDECVKDVGHVFEGRHIQHGKTVPVLPVVCPHQRQAVGEEFTTS